MPSCDCRGLLEATIASAFLVTMSCGHTEESASSKADRAIDTAGSPGSSAPAKQPQVIFTPTGQSDRRVFVEVVQTPHRIRRGLMFRTHLAKNAGMLFIMAEEREHSFWMKNTLIPLDIIFVTSDFKVAGVSANAVPRTLTSRRVGKPSKYVVEVNGGWAQKNDVGPGTAVRFVHVNAVP